MASDTQIANLALNHLGIGKEIQNLTTDTSDEATACRRFYEIARDILFRDFNWPFATKIVALDLIEEDPNEEWAYSYRYPTDCLRTIKILSGTRNDSHQNRVPYKISNDTSGLVIYTDTESAELEYVMRITNPDLFTQDFTMALSFKLANLISPRVTAGDPFKLGDRAMQQYILTASRAMANAVNEEQPDQIVESEFIRARE